MLAKVSHHPKLCLFLGASLVEPLTLVTELMSGGSVRRLLDDLPHLPRLVGPNRLSGLTACVVWASPPVVVVVVVAAAAAVVTGAWAARFAS